MNKFLATVAIVAGLMTAGSSANAGIFGDAVAKAARGAAGAVDRAHGDRPA